MEKPYSAKAFIIASIIACILLGAVNTYLVRSFGFTGRTAIKDAIVSLQFWIFGIIIIGNTLRYYFPQQSRFIFLSAIIVANTLLWVTLTSFVLPHWLRKVNGYSAFFEQSVPVRVAFCFLLYTAAAMFFAFLYTLNNQQLAESRKNEAIKLSKEAELNSLQEKLQPHFLFNSLNSINALVVAKPELARQMVHQLSDFLRGTLKRENNEWISLEQELTYLELYLDIEKVRFGHRLSILKGIDESSLSCSLPPFILLPILENAIKFGLYDTLDDISIEINSRFKDKILEVSISNPFDPATAGQSRGTGFGLKSVARRLNLLFERSDLIKTSATNHTFTSTIFIPQPS